MRRSRDEEDKCRMIITRSRMMSSMDAKDAEDEKEQWSSLLDEEQ